MQLFPDDYYFVFYDLRRRVRVWVYLSPFSSWFSIYFLVSRTPCVRRHQNKRSSYFNFLFFFSLSLPFSHLVWPTEFNTNQIEKNKQQIITIIIIIREKHNYAHFCCFVLFEIKMENQRDAILGCKVWKSCRFRIIRLSVEFHVWNFFFSVFCFGGDRRRDAQKRIIRN